MSEHAGMPASYDADISREPDYESEPVPLSRAIVETGIRVMLASRDAGRLSTEGFVDAVLILFDSHVSDNGSQQSAAIVQT